MSYATAMRAGGTLLLTPHGNVEVPDRLVGYFMPSESLQFPSTK